MKLFNIVFQGLEGTSIEATPLKSQSVNRLFSGLHQVFRLRKRLRYRKVGRGAWRVSEFIKSDRVREGMPNKEAFN